MSQGGEDAADRFGTWSARMVSRNERKLGQLRSVLALVGVPAGVPRDRNQAEPCHTSPVPFIPLAHLVRLLVRTLAL